MPGMLILAFFSVLIVLRATRGGRIPGGVPLMAFGVWLLWTGAVRHHDEFYVLDSPPRIGILLLGTWLVVKGALRFSA